MADADSTIPLKRCSSKEHCVHPEAVDGWLPCDATHFEWRDKRRWRAQCRACACARRRRWDDANREKVREANRRSYYKHGDRIREECSRHRAEHGDEIREKRRVWYFERAAERRVYARQWYAENRVEQNEKRRHRRTRDINHFRGYMREWRLKNPERFEQSQRRWLSKNRVWMKVRDGRRMARRRSLPDTLTIEQWSAAMDYFKDCCAVCGRSLNHPSGKHKAAADHWIPLASTDCPGTIPTNIVPLCHAIKGGKGGCNNSKGAKPPEQWLIERFGEQRAQEILERIRQYFEWVAAQE